MQEHQLSYFEKLIHYEFKRRLQKTPDIYFFNDTYSTIKLETERVLEYFSHYLFNVSDEKEIALSVQAYQHKIILLIDNVSKYLKQEDIINIDQVTTDATWKNLYKTVYNSLTSILGFIETEWAKYQDIHANVPVAYLLIAKQRWILVYRCFQQNCNLPELMKPYYR